jgi:LAO/AO transport system ATPase
MPDALLDRFRRGDRLALSRLLTRVGRGEAAEETLARLGPPAKPSRVVAVTGSAGVGKSTLVGKLIEQSRRHGQTVAVLACDPESPLSGGALLGDRFRMPSLPADDGVFIRSLAAASGRGALAERLDAQVRVLEAFGFDLVVVETVGAGQGDTAVRALADVVVLLLQPETGDDIQWEKAGLLEVADVVVIHKADLPGADQLEGQVKSTLALSANAAPPVLRVSGRTGAGLDELWQEITGRPLRRDPGREGGRDLLRVAQETLADRFARAEAAGDAGLQELVARWRRGELPRDQAAETLWRVLGMEDAPS